MEHVFGRYVECPYSVKYLFYNRKYYPSKIIETHTPHYKHSGYWINPPQNMQNTLYYDPTLGRDKVMTLGNSFNDGSIVEECSYIPCQELMYYIQDLTYNGYRELDFNIIGKLKVTLNCNMYIIDHNLNTKFTTNFHPESFTECFSNFPGKNFLSKVLKNPGIIYAGKEIQVVFHERYFDIYDKEDINQTAGIWKEYT